jgi:hypothetical protein
MKILPCNRCQHYIHSEREPSAFSQCGHPDTQKIDFVTGQTNPMFFMADAVLKESCGPTTMPFLLLRSARPSFGTSSQKLILLKRLGFSFTTKVRCFGVTGMVRPSVMPTPALSSQPITGQS